MSSNRVPQFRSDGSKSDDFWEYSKPNSFDFGDDSDIEFLSDPRTFTSSSPKPPTDIVLSSSNVVETIKLMNLDEAKQRVSQTLQKVQSKHISPIGFSSNHIDACIRQLIAGESPNLHSFKSKEDKLALLEAAINCYDGDVIMAALIFMEKSLCWRIFANELLTRPVAVDHYIDYLRESNRQKDLTDFLAMLGRSEDAAIVNYTQAIKCDHMETKIKHLKHCSNNFFHDLQDEIFSPAILDQINLYEHQLPVDVQDAKTLDESRLSVMPFPPFLGSSVISTLFYCVAHHYGTPEKNFASPRAVKNNHSLSDKQYHWTALRALAKVKKWTEIEELFHYQTFLGSKKIRNIIPFDKVVKILGKEEAPQLMLATYLKLVDDDDVRSKLSQEFNIKR